MKYDPDTDRFTLPSGQQVHRSVVDVVVSDVLEGRAVTILPSDTPEKFWYLARTATDEDGRAIVSKREVQEKRLVRRLRRLFASWGQRQPPEARAEGCTYPRCSCRPPAGGGAVACVPPLAAEMGLATADEIAPPCGTCGKSIRVGDSEPQSGADVYRAQCSDVDCDWRALVVVQVLPAKQVPQGEQ